MSKKFLRGRSQGRDSIYWPGKREEKREYALGSILWELKDEGGDDGYISPDQERVLKLLG